MERINPVQNTRLISKRGILNLRSYKIPNKYLLYTRDLANTLVTIRWRWIISFLIVVHICCYLIFGGLWWLDAWLSGDFETNKTGNFCIVGTRNFRGYFQLSIETITTTGYGYLYPTEHCKLSWFILTLSTLVMIGLDGAFISVLMVKICRTHYRQYEYTIFSKKAVICLRNGKLCLMIRLNDYSNRHTQNTKISLHFSNTHFKPGNDFFESKLIELSIEPYGFILWPVDIVHIIDERSPLWEYSALDVLEKRFELFVTVTGSTLNSGDSTCSQKSYCNSDILWGFRFNRCMEYDFFKQRCDVNNMEFNKTSRYTTSLCSGKNLHYMKLKVSL